MHIIRRTSPERLLPFRMLSSLICTVNDVAWRTRHAAVLLLVLAVIFKEQSNETSFTGSLSRTGDAASKGLVGS